MRLGASRASCALIVVIEDVDADSCRRRMAAPTGPTSTATEMVAIAGADFEFVEGRSFRRAVLDHFFAHRYRRCQSEDIAALVRSRADGCRSARAACPDFGGALVG